MRIKQSTFISILVIFVISVACVTGCSIYNADIPEYSTNESRDSNFKARTFEEDHSAAPPERKSVGDKVDEGIASVNEAASQFGDQEPSQIDASQLPKNDSPSVQLEDPNIPDGLSDMPDIEEQSLGSGPSSIDLGSSLEAEKES